MTYKLKYRKYKSLNLFIICGCLVVGFSNESNATGGGSAPLKVYIPNVASFPRYFTADKLEYDVDSSVLTAKGKVLVEQGNMIVSADSIEYDQVKNIVRASGNVAILDSSGKVSFADTTELKSEIKDGIIHNFQAHLADNEQFMAAEVRKIQSPTTNDKSFFGRVFASLSPDSSDKNTATRFSQLEPTAGEAVVAEDKAVIGNEPLITLPDTSPQALVQEKIKDEKKQEKTSPEQVLDNQIKADQKPAIDLQKVVPIVEPKKEEPKAEVPTVPTAPLIEPKKEEPKPVVPAVPLAQKAVKEPVKKLSKPAPKAVEAKQIVEPSVESVDSLSPKSRELLKKVSPSIASKKEALAPKPFGINRSHDMQDLFKAGESPNAMPSPESLGVKVERKDQKISLEYELERAYDAVSSGQSDVAIETYKNILNNAPNNTQALFGLATLYHRARQFDMARPLYGRLLAIDPNHRDGFNNFLVLLADEAPHEALTELEKLEAKNLGFSTIPAQMAVIYQKLGEQDKAIGKMFRAVSLAPENLTYRYNLAIMLDKQKNYEEAAKLYSQLIEASQRGEKIPGNIANIQQRLTFISSNR